MEANEWCATDQPSATPINEWHATEKPTRPQPVVSLKGTMGTMGWDPQISENDIFHNSAAKANYDISRDTGRFKSTH